MDSLLEQAAADLAPDIRRAAFSAARQVPTLSVPVMMGLILGTRDTDLNTAYAAFAAFATKKDLHLTASLWHQLAYSLTMACNSPSVEIRRVAAHVIANLREQYPSDEIRNKMRRLDEVLALDVAHSVRTIVSRGIAGGESATTGSRWAARCRLSHY